MRKLLSYHLSVSPKGILSFYFMNPLVNVHVYFLPQHWGGLQEQQVFLTSELPPRLVSNLLFGWSLICHLPVCASHVLRLQVCNTIPVLFCTHSIK